MELYEIVIAISHELSWILINAISDMGYGAYRIILPSWLPQLFDNGATMTIGTETFTYINVSDLVYIIVTFVVWYLCISITYKAIKKLFKLGFGAFGL